MDSGLHVQARLAQGLLTGHPSSLRNKAVSKTPLSSRPIKIIVIFVLSNPLPWRKIMQAPSLKLHLCHVLIIRGGGGGGKNMIPVGKFFCFLLPLLKCYQVLFLIS